MKAGRTLSHFLKKKGFTIKHEWKGRYQKGVTEYLLACPHRIEEAATSVRSLTLQMSALTAAEGDSRSQGLLGRIVDAHLGRIHTLIPLSDGTFTSGSEDNCLYKWDKEGNKVKTVHEVEPTCAGERDWVTAAAVINDDYWVSGLRSGKVSIWTTEGEHVRNIMPRLPNRREHISKQYNKQRVNCFGIGSDSLFVGLPTMISEYNWVAGRTTSITKVDPNDWVFCIHPLSADRMLTVIGGRIDLIQRRGKEFSGTTILQEGKKNNTGQRPFISSLKPVVGQDNHFALAVFGGSVKVMDAGDGSIVADWHEHEKRVWAIESLGPHRFASCAEDSLIKLWDTREAASIKTIQNPGQVTSMLSLSEHTLVTGVSESSHSAALYFRDLRL